MSDRNSKKPNLILIGGGGHCTSVIDVVEQQKIYKIAGILDPNLPFSEVLGYPILGSDDMIEELVDEHTYFLITVGQIKNNGIRKHIANKLEKYNANLATVISPLAYVSSHASINKGTIIMHYAFVNAKARIGQHCIINTKANIEHDARVYDFCHISTGAIVNGHSIIEEGTFVGSNATISNGIIVKKNSIISAGDFIKK